MSIIKQIITVFTFPEPAGPITKTAAPDDISGVSRKSTPGQIMGYIRYLKYWYVLDCFLLHCLTG